jgi:hypothetical protein
MQQGVQKMRCVGGSCNVTRQEGRGAPKDLLGHPEGQIPHGKPRVYGRIILRRNFEIMIVGYKLHSPVSG